MKPSPNPGMHARLKDASLVVFSLAAQTAAGMLVWLAVLTTLGVQTAMDRTSITGWAMILMLGALGVSLLHLGSPLKAPHTLRRLKTSWLSREVALALAFTLCTAVLFGSRTPASHSQGAENPWQIIHILLCAILGLALVLAMAQVYRLRTAPDWGGPLTTPAFCLTALLLGGSALQPPPLPSPFSTALLACLALQIVISFWDALGLASTKSALLPLAVMRIACLLAAVLALLNGSPLAAAGLIVLSELLGRVEFYTRRTRLGI